MPTWFLLKAAGLSWPFYQPLRPHSDTWSSMAIQAKPCSSTNSQVEQFAKRFFSLSSLCEAIDNFKPQAGVNHGSELRRPQKIIGQAYELCNCLFIWHLFLLPSCGDLTETGSLPVTKWDRETVPGVIICFARAPIVSRTWKSLGPVIPLCDPPSLNSDMAQLGFSISVQSRRDSFHSSVQTAR